LLIFKEAMVYTLLIKFQLSTYALILDESIIGFNPEGLFDRTP